MAKLYFHSLLLLSLTSLKADSFYNIWQDIHEFQEKINARMQEAFNDFSIIETKQFKNNNKVNFINEKDKIIVTLTLPVEKINSSDISTEALGNNLEGTLNYENHKLIFFVKKGKIFGTSLIYESTKQLNDKEKKSFATVENIKTLPSQVDNLENTEIKIENNKLILSFPKINPRRNWKKIDVK